MLHRFDLNQLIRLLVKLKKNRKEKNQLEIKSNGNFFLSLFYFHGKKFFFSHSFRKSRVHCSIIISVSSDDDDENDEQHDLFHTILTSLTDSHSDTEI